ncbi:MAG: hypothetical protein MR880_04555, partial [Negativibacillus massiliensis]|nr:hypothetical protein [Negativibacillus massiliensis]
MKTTLLKSVSCLNGNIFPLRKKLSPQVWEGHQVRHLSADPHYQNIILPHHCFGCREAAVWKNILP